MKTHKWKNIVRPITNANDELTSEPHLTFYFFERETDVLVILVLHTYIAVEWVS